MGGVVYAVTSGKGGVGKTTTAVSLAVALRQRGHAVAVVDADLGMPNVASVLDLEADVTLHDLLAAADGAAWAGVSADIDGTAPGAVDDRSVAGAVVELADGLGVLAGDATLEGYAAAEPTGLAAVVDALADRYDCVLLDTGGGLSYEGVLPLELSDAAILVTAPDPAAVADTAKSRELAARLDVPVAGVVVTRTTDGNDPAELAGRLGVDLLGAIPFDPAVTECATAGVPLATHAPDGAATEAYGRVAGALSAEVRASLDPASGGSIAEASVGPAATDGADRGGVLAAVPATDPIPVDDADGPAVADGEGDAPAGGVLSRLSGWLS